MSLFLLAREKEVKAIQKPVRFGVPSARIQEGVAPFFRSAAASPFFLFAVLMRRWQATTYGTFGYLDWAFCVSDAERLVLDAWVGFAGNRVKNVLVLPDLVILPFP